MAESVQPLETVTVETDGRVYSGVGVDESAIESALSQTSFGKREDAKAEKAAEPAKAEPVTESAEPPRLTRGQRRFSALTDERDKAIARAQTLEAELKAEREARTAKAAEPVKAEPIKATEPEKKPTELRPRPSIDDIGVKYADWAAYQADDTAWIDEKIAHAKTDLEARAVERIEAERASRELSHTVAEILERGRTAYPDFDAVLAKAQVVFPGPIVGMILSAPDSEHLQYALASDEALSTRIAALDPVAAGFELGRLSSGRVSARPASPARPVTTQAPPPYQPVSGASRTASPSPEELAKAGKYQDYKATRHTQLGIKAR